MKPISESPISEESQPVSGKARIQRILRLLILVALLAFAGVYLHRQGSDLWQRLEFHAWLLAPLVVAEAALLVIRGLLTRELCQLFKARLRVGEATALVAWASLANYVTPFVGGASVRAVYLKKRYDLPFASFASVQAAIYILQFMVESLIGLAGLLALQGVAPAIRASLATLLLGVLGASLLLYHWPFSLPAGKGRLMTFLRRALQGWQKIRQAVSVRLVGLLVIHIVTLAICIALSFAVVGMPLTWAAALLIAVLLSLSIVIAVTPASLGISEGIVAFSAKALALHTPTALAAATLRRLMVVAVTAIIAGWGSLVYDRPRD